jgi:CHASE2 domain-containing sensor protein
MLGLSKAAILGILTGLLGLTVSLTPFGAELEENVGLSILFKLRGTRQAPADVIIVSLDDMSAAHLKLPNDPAKWPRVHHARLIDNLVDAGAAAIAFDMIFSEARVSEHDHAFAEAIRRARNIVLFEYLSRETVPAADEKGSAAGDVYIEKRVPPLPLLADAAVALAPFPLPKVPVRVSWYWTFKTAAGETPTLPVVSFQVFALEVYEEFRRLLERVSPLHAVTLPPHRQALHTTTVDKLVRALKDILHNQPLVAQQMLEELHRSEAFAVDAKKRQLLRSLIGMYQSPDSQYLNFYGPPGTITTVPYYQALQVQEPSLSSGHEPDFRGKAVFVGLSERLRPEQKDGFYTVFSQANGLDLSGVEIAATAFANLLEDAPIRTLPFHRHLAVIVIWGIGLGLLCRPLPALTATSSALGLSAAYFAVAFHQFKTASIWYPFVTPLIFQTPFVLFGAILWKYLDTNRERKNIKIIRILYT